MTAAYLSATASFLLVQSSHNEFPRLIVVRLGQPNGHRDLFATNAATPPKMQPPLYAILQSQFETREPRGWRLIFKANDIKWAPAAQADDVVKDPARCEPHKPSSYGKSGRRRTRDREQSRLRVGGGENVSDGRPAIANTRARFCAN